MAAFVDGVDSHYQWVKSRLAIINPNRSVLGLLQAQDWPQQPVKTAAFYLLVVGETPLGPQAGSISVPHVSHLLQWVWVIKGSETAQDQRMRNRGDRFRIHMAMKDEITQALYPNFAEKQTWSVNTQSGVWTGVSYSPPERISWTRPQFMEKFDRDSGVIYGTVRVNVSDMLAQITA